MIRLKSALFADLDGSVEGLRRALQNAIELEHATIPPYLYALYSIKPGTNREIAGLIKSIVTEEMLHMSLDCNILNAIGGAPKIDDPGFLPKYPGPLPGGVESDLIVPLAPFSKPLVHDTFMTIEEPEDPLNFPVVKLALAGGQKQVTIGQFYAKIAKRIKELRPRDFSGKPNKQLTTGFKPLQQIHVHNAETAVAAIHLIVAQGEGTKASPLDPEHAPAHYYRFAEIYHGRKLIRNPGIHPGAPPFVYGGHKIEFDRTGVWPAITNPSRRSYAPGSKVYNLNETFNYTYTGLLKSLELVFNGDPDQLGPAIGLMESMREQAQVMMSTETAAGQTAGPSFEYTPVNA
jgi:hypothetical protein